MPPPPHHAPLFSPSADVTARARTPACASALYHLDQMPLFSFRRLEIDPLAVAMTGVKTGERLLQIGLDDATTTGLLAAKPGLSGSASHAVASDDDAVRVNRGAKKAGALVEVRVTPLDALPFEPSSFDVLVLHSASGQLASAEPAVRLGILREAHRVLRPGGRVVVIESGAPSGLTSVFKSAPQAQAAYDSGGGTSAALRDAGFAAIRDLGDREGLKFVEGLRSGSLDTSRSTGSGRPA
jgi:SAM-dependent methyltransferase